MSGDPNDLETFGQRVRDLRKKLGLRLNELARRSGVSATYLSNVEHGARDVSLAMIQKLAAGLDVAPAELVGGVVPLTEKGLKAARLFDEADPKIREPILAVLRAMKSPTPSAPSAPSAPSKRTR